MLTNKLLGDFFFNTLCVPTDSGLVLLSYTVGVQMMSDD